MSADRFSAVPEFTRLLRTSTEEQWPVVRDFLDSVGADPARCAVGDIYPDQGLVIVVVASDGRTFELTTWHDPHDPSKFTVEESRELDTEGRFHHSWAIHAALAWLSQEAPDTADPIDVLAEATGRFTRAMRADNDWSPFREFLIGHGVDPQESILVDYRHRLAVDSPPERTGTTYFRRKWFMFIGAEDSLAGALVNVKEWHEIDETEARIRHGAYVDAALRIAALESGRSTA